jgi:hypothetical protein
LSKQITKGQNKKACKKNSKITQEILDMDGMSGKMTRHFYNNILNFQDARYLEIGTWKGSSVCSAMYGNNAKVCCIDNWSQFGCPKIEFLMNIEKFKGVNEVSYIEQDCFSVDLSNLPKITQKSQNKPLTYKVLHYNKETEFQITPNEKGLIG